MVIYPVDSVIQLLNLEFSGISLSIIHIAINILGQITNCSYENARLAGENELWPAENHIASALLLIGQQGLVRKPFESARVFHGDSIILFICNPCGIICTIARSQMMLLGPEINDMPSKSHCSILLFFWHHLIDFRSNYHFDRLVFLVLFRLITNVRCPKSLELLK